LALFITLGASLILVILILYIGWVLLNWRNGILLFLGVLMLAFIITGVVLTRSSWSAKSPQRAARRFHQRRHTRAEDARASSGCTWKRSRRAPSTRPNAPSFTASCWRTATGC